MSERGRSTLDFVLNHGPVTSLEIMREVGSITAGRCIFEMKEEMPNLMALLIGRKKVMKANGKEVWVNTYEIVGASSKDLAEIEPQPGLFE